MSGFGEIDQMNIESLRLATLDRSRVEFDTEVVAPEFGERLGERAFTASEVENEPGTARVVEHPGGNSVGRVPREVEAVLAHVTYRNR